MFMLILRRIATLIPTLLFASFAIFSLQQLLPGDPAVMLAGGVQAPPERVEQIREEFGFDDPYFVQYGHWLSDASRFEFGNSIASDREVRGEILSRFPTTFSLAAAGLFVGLIIGVITGFVSALRPGSIIDRVAVGFTTLWISIPGFWLALILVLVFAVKLHWLPPSGYRPFTESPLEWARYMALPALSIGLAVAATIARQLRAALIDVLDAPYIRTAWAKGGTPTLIIAKHALKNASIPVVAVLGLLLSVLLGGTVIIETIFSIPGLGQYMIQSITQNDLPVVQGVTMFFVLVFVTVNLLLDLTYMILDPRVRVSA
jgi:peptide/nickel transport system permease protein